MTARRTRTVQVQPHQTCPVCKDVLDPRLQTLGVCPGCGTLYHDACASELGGCGVLGCAPARTARPASPRHDLPRNLPPELSESREKLIPIGIIMVGYVSLSLLNLVFHLSKNTCTVIGWLWVAVAVFGQYELQRRRLAAQKVFLAKYGA